jgi:hypothetical protein
MKIGEAIAFAERWTKDLKDEASMPMFQAMEVLLKQVKQSEKDIKHLTNAVRAGMTRNKELMNELRTSKKSSRGRDLG